jgi:hypothetical protein
MLSLGDDLTCFKNDLYITGTVLWQSPGLFILILTKFAVCTI